MFTKKAIPEIFYLINDEESFLNIFIEKFEESNHEEKEIIFLIIIKIINEFPNLIIIYFQQLISVFSHIAISDNVEYQKQILETLLLFTESNTNNMIIQNKSFFELLEILDSSDNDYVKEILPLILKQVKL